MDKAACETAIPLATTPRYHPERCHKATRAMRSGLEKKGAALGNAGSPHGAEFQHEPEFRPLENVRDRGFVCDSCRDGVDASGFLGPQQHDSTRQCSPHWQYFECAFSGRRGRGGDRGSPRAADLPEADDEHDRRQQPTSALKRSEPSSPAIHFQSVPRAPQIRTKPLMPKPSSENAAASSILRVISEFSELANQDNTSSKRSGSRQGRRTSKQARCSL